MRFPCICETRLTGVQREGWRVYSSDMGYVPWKVRHLFHYPHFFSDQFLRWGFMVIFWNLAGVPFVSTWFTWLLNDPDLPVVLYIFRCIHGIARARELPFLDNCILHPLRYTPDSLLRVCTSSLLADVDAHECNVAGTLAWRKRVISRCRLKASTNSAKHSLSSPGIRYRTLHSSKQNMGKTLGCWRCLSLTAWRNRLLTSGWWAYSRRPNYVADRVISLTWGACIGTASVIPYFYSVFFITVLIHRCSRDFERFVSSLNVAVIHLTIFPDARGSMARTGTAIARLSSINLYHTSIEHRIYTKLQYIE